MFNGTVVRGKIIKFDKGKTGIFLVNLLIQNIQSILFFSNQIYLNKCMFMEENKENYES